MPKIVFWSTNAVAVGQTHAAIALATLMAIEEDYSNILLHGHWQAKKVSSAFEDYEVLKSKGVFNNSSVGITALTRLVESNKLTPESIRNYAKPILKQRLDVMYGTYVENRLQFQELIEKFPSIVNKADDAYDFVWVDLPKSLDREYIKGVLESADLVICTFNQDVTLLEDAIKNYQETDVLKNKKKIMVMCNYEDKSKYSIPNIRRKYGIKDEIFCIPHNYLFTDACNDGNVVEGFFYKNLGADKYDYNGEFIDEIRRIIKKILELVKV